MSTTRRAALARLAVFAARPNGRRITRSSAGDPMRETLFALTEAADFAGFRARRGGA
jgi:hypothetical protein